MAMLPAILLAAAVGASAAPAVGTWTVGKSDASPAMLVRTSEGVTVDYHLVPGDYDELKLTVDPCGQGPWWMKDGLNPTDETLAERRAFIRKSIAELFHNARLNCTLPDGLEDRFMTGFDVAYAQFETLNK